MLTVTLPLTDAQLRTLKRKRCKVRRIGPYLYEVDNRRGKLYHVKLSRTADGFLYTCTSDAGPCQSEGFGNVCRHATSAALVAHARNEALKRASNVVQFPSVDKRKDGALLGSANPIGPKERGIRI